MEFINEQYQIEGVNVLDLCKEYDTPVYVYNTAKMQ